LGPAPEDVERLLTPRTRLFMYSSPSNPTGAVWSAETIRAIARALEKFPRVVVVSDDIYGRLVYGGVKATNILEIAPQLERAHGAGQRLLQGLRDDRPAARMGVRARGRSSRG